MAAPQGEQLQEILRHQTELRQRYLVPPAERAASATDGVHHAAFICRDVEETILFYRDVMGCPLVDLMENRDYPGSTHFFIDIGNENIIAFFDFPGHPHPDYLEAIGASHHLALSVTPESYDAIKQRLGQRSLPYQAVEAGATVSLYLADPNGLRLELFREPPGHVLGEYIL